MRKNAVLIWLIAVLAFPSYAGALTIKSIDFQTVGNKSRIQIGLDGKAEYDVTRKNNTVILKIDNAKIPQNLQRPFITKDFISAIDQFVPKQKNNNVLISISMKQMSPYFVSLDKNQLLMDFDIPENIKNAPPQDIHPVVLAPKSDLKKIVPDTKSFKSGKQDEADLNIKKFSGQRVNLDFQNADIQNVLRILADISGINIVTADEVKGQVTIKLKDIPWDEALNVVLESKGLGKMTMGNIVWIAPSEKIQASQERMIASKKTLEQMEQLQTKVIPVNFAKATELATTLKGKEVGLVSDRGSITAEERTNVVIAKDISGNLDAISKMISKLDRATPQVLISARIVQADDNFLKAMGVQWGGSFRRQTDHSHFGLSGKNGSSTATNLFDTVSTNGNASWSSTVYPAPSLAVNLPTAQPSGFGLTLGRLGSTLFDLDVRIDLGENTGDARVLARPRVVTLDNKKATIKQGEKYPYVVRNKDGELSTELKDIDLLLEVTPRIAFDGSINMEVHITRNALGALTNSLGDPDIISREITTEIMVKDGETAVIGGIIEEETKVNVYKVPFLGDLPFIGYLFKNKKNEKTKKELLIFINPKIVDTDVAFNK